MAVVHELCNALSENYGTELQELKKGLQAEGNPAAIHKLQHVLDALKNKELDDVNLYVRQLQQLAWDNIHLGHWKDVAMVWRDLYALMCLLAATLDLTNPHTPETVTSQQDNTAVATQQRQQQQQQERVIAGTNGESGRIVQVQQGQQLQEQVKVGVQPKTGQKCERPAHFAMLSSTRVQGALKDLDMGIMMGGPLFKPLLHAAVAQWEAQRRQQAAVQAAAAAAVLGQEHQQAATTAAGSQQGHTAHVKDATHGAHKPAAKRLKHEQAVNNSAAADITSRTNIQQASTTPPAHAEHPTVVTEGHAESLVLVQALNTDALHRLADAALPAGSLRTVSSSDGPCLRSAVPQYHLPSLQQFLTDVMVPAKPATISGAMECWPALQRWNNEAYLMQVAGHRTVPVEVGSHYLEEGWGQQVMTFEQYIRHHIACSSGDTQSNTQQAHAGMHDAHHEQTNTQATYAHVHAATAAGGKQLSADTNAHVLANTSAPVMADTTAPVMAEVAAQGAGVPRTGYLAQHPLLEQIPALALDVLTPEYCVLGKDEEEGGGVQAVNAWFGPAGTVTPLHTDPPHNLLCQVVGYKYVRLYAPDQTPAMYPYTEGMNTNSSQVDLHHVDHAAFPSFAAAPFQDCILQPGDMLYIPPGWWHFVQSLTISFSVSFWWQ